MTILCDERVEARQALAPVHRYVRLMTQQLEKLGVDVPNERLILDHGHLHVLVDPVLVKITSSTRGVGWPQTPGLIHGWHLQNVS
jgi:hypothetical protein